MGLASTKFMDKKIAAAAAPRPMAASRKLHRYFAIFISKAPLFQVRNSDIFLEFYYISIPLQSQFDNLRFLSHHTEIPPVDPVGFDVISVRKIPIHDTRGYTDTRYPRSHASANPVSPAAWPDRKEPQTRELPRSCQPDPRVRQRGQWKTEPRSWKRRYGRPESWGR